MADKAAIELGERLNRLIQNEDFFPIFGYVDGRLSSLEADRDAQASQTNCNPAIISHISQRIDELISLRVWVFDSIEAGGREKVKKEKESAASETEGLSPLRV